MTPLEELNIILQLISKYSLPLSPILEYAINEKKESFSAQMQEKDSIANMKEEQNDKFADVLNLNSFNLSIMRFCSEVVSMFKEHLTDRDSDICLSLLSGGGKKELASKYNLTQERIRQIFIESLKTIKTYVDSLLNNLNNLKNINKGLENKIYLLTSDSNKEKVDNVQSIINKEKKLCEYAKSLLNCDVGLLKLSVRTQNVLKRAEITNFKEIPQLTSAQILKFRGGGLKTQNELKFFLINFGLDFGLSYEEIVDRLLEYTNADFPRGYFVLNNSDNITSIYRNKTKDESHRELSKNDDKMELYKPIVIKNESQFCYLYRSGVLLYSSIGKIKQYNEKFYQFYFTYSHLKITLLKINEKSVSL